MLTMGKRAMGMADRFGLAVFPVHTIEDDGTCSCKLPCSSPGKHPIASLAPQGLHNATRDTQLIREWWSLFPDANIAVATGDVSGVMVLDIDPDKGGDETFHNLESRFGMTPDTWTVRTGGGGAHLYFSMPPADVRNSTGAVGPGIDVRGNGGYAVAPPSKHEAGNRYRWAEGLTPKDVGLSAPPDWLMERMIPKGTGTSAPIPSKIGEGQRNTMLASVAGSLRRKGCTEEEIFGCIRIMNKNRCNPPLSENEVRMIARSIERYRPETRGRFG